MIYLLLKAAAIFSLIITPWVCFVHFVNMHSKIERANKAIEHLTKLVEGLYDDDDDTQDEYEVGDGIPPFPHVNSEGYLV